jgi:hypothetical protein
MNATLGRRTIGIDGTAFIRRVVGGIWLAGATFNVGWTLRQEEPWSWLEESRLPTYRWFFGEVAGANPALWTVALIAGEVALGLLTLSQRWSRLGLISGALFSAFLFTLGTPYTLMMDGYALLLAWLARRAEERPFGAAPD